MRLSRGLLVLAALLLAAGCAAAEPAHYPSPEAAASALAEAVRAGSTEQLEVVFGSDASELLSSGDDVADHNRRARFLELYENTHRLDREDAQSATLVVGPDEWPFPVPIVQGDGGHWSFDTWAGLDEVVNRRIGRNELDTIETCRAIVDAQREYAGMRWPGKEPGEYAQRFLSSAGGSGASGRDGLYWQTGSDEPLSPLGSLVAGAQAEGYALPEGGAVQPYHGYVYRILTAQGSYAPGGRESYLVDGRMTGGFAVVAYPVEYGSSGLMTFLVNANGIVYECDLGDDTAAIAGTMGEYDPDPRWSVCD